MDVPHPPARGPRDGCGIAAADEHVAGVEAEAHVRAREQPLDVLRSLDDRSDVRVHDDFELRRVRDGLDERQRLEQRRPLGIGELGPLLVPVATRRGREHEEIGPEGAEAVCLLLDRRELGVTASAVVKHRRYEATDATEAMRVQRARGVVRIGG